MPSNLFICQVGRQMFSVCLVLFNNGVNALTNPVLPSSFQDRNANSLAGLPPSPGRYAQVVNMTVAEVKRTKELHNKASEELHLRLQCKDLSGVEKHTLLCQHRLKYGRHPFSCPDCWSYNPACVCNLVGDRKLALPSNLEVAVWTHHREWGLTSNTGCLLALTFGKCKLLMKGLPEHDNHLEQNILNDDNCLAVVLWPDQSINPNTSEKPTSISLEEVKAAMKKNRRVVLIAVDGTWRNARRMVARLPPGVPRLDLSANVVYSQTEHSGESILAPLRAKGSNAVDRQVCTAEAVAGALMELGLARQDGKHLLEITRTKVELVRRYRGKVQL